MFCQSHLCSVFWTHSLLLPSMQPPRLNATPRGSSCLDLLCLPPTQIPTAFSIGWQRELLKVCDSHVWNPAALPTALRIKPTLNCYEAYETFLPLYDQVPPLHTSLTGVCFLTAPGPLNSHCDPGHIHPLPHSTSRPPLLRHLFRQPSVTKPLPAPSPLVSFCPTTTEALWRKVLCCVLPLLYPQDPAQCSVPGRHSI